MATADLVFKAIAHPTRRDIISLLSNATRSVKQLTAEFEMSQPAVSQHLKELREAELVAFERVGLERRYRLTPKPLSYVVEWLAPYRTLFDRSGHAWTLTPAETIPGKRRGKERQ
jgi:DNA-binding transcriptional ArsR family regulator